MKLLDAKLEYTKENNDSIFYRYCIGGYQIWFSQYKDNGKKCSHQNLVGCIFSVGVAPKKTNSKLPTIRIFERIGSGKGYPNEYVYQPLRNCFDNSLGEIDELIKNAKKAKQVLASIQDFFENSFHKELFDKRKYLEGKQ